VELGSGGLRSWKLAGLTFYGGGVSLDTCHLESSEIDDRDHEQQATTSVVMQTSGCRAKFVEALTNKASDDY
jgi:hypothetical protein